MMPGQAYPAYDQPLQETPEDPSMALGMAMSGGAMAPATLGASFLKNLFMNAAIANALTGWHEGPLEEQIGARGKVIPERLGESHLKSGGNVYPEVKDLGPEAELPVGAIPNWYTGEHARAQEAYSPYRVKGTEGLRYPNLQSAGGKTSQLYDITELAHPSLLRTSSAPILPRDVIGDPAQQFGSSMAGRNPLDLIWHGLATDAGTAAKAVGNIRDIRSSGGMKAGWFSRTPQSNFGPLFIGADPRDLPKARVEPRSLRVDPSAQIVPEWEPHWGELTASGRPVPPLSVHPSKLAVIDQQGNLIGSVADYRPGLQFGEPVGTMPRRFLDPREYPRGTRGYGEVTSPKEAESVIEAMKEDLKNFPKDYGPEAKQDFRMQVAQSIRDIRDAMESEPKALRGYVTQHLPDITKLFEEAE